MPTADELAVIRSWCGSTTGTPGSPHDADDLDARLARLTTPHAVALEILRERRADILTNPLSFEVDGDYRENRTDNLKALDGQIAQLERICGQPTVSTTALRRAGRGR